MGDSLKGCIGCVVKLLDACAQFELNIDDEEAVYRLMSQVRYFIKYFNCIALKGVINKRLNKTINKTTFL